MLDYPLNLPGTSAYTLLKIDPEATVEEIREAKQEVISDLRSRLDAVNAALQKVHSAVPGLREAQRRLKELTAEKSENVNAAELARAQHDMAAIQKQVRAINPAFPELEEKAADLDRQINEINSMMLEKPSARAEHDAQHPPLELLKLEDCRQDDFRDNRVAISLLRQELSAFLEKRGEQVYHPSDVSRRDFTADFSFCPLLDE
jgi:chromosome segregation ATPase